MATRKRMCSPTSSPRTLITPSKNPRVFSPTTPGKGRPAAFVNRVLESSSRPVPTNVRPRNVEYPLLDDFWKVFGDQETFQFLRSEANLDEYKRLLKYFHGRLVFLVRGLHLPELEALYALTVPAWHAKMDSETDEVIEDAFEAAYDWAQEEVIKKIKAYSELWFASPAGQAYISAWTKAKSSKSSRYPYPDDPKLPEDMLATGETRGFLFERSNVIDFWLVGLASVVTDKTPDETYVAWIRNDPDNAWYTHLRTSALILILKYSMMAMGMPQGDIYKLTVATIMRPVLTFNITDGIDGMLKLTLVYRKSREPLELSKFEAYVDLVDTLSGTITIPPTPEQTAIDLASPRLSPGVRAADAFNSVLLDPSDSRFVASEGLSNAEHTRQHAQAVIQLNKAFDLNPDPHRLDSLAPSILFITAMDEIAVRYSRLPLERADDFHRTRMEYEICCLDIIIAQAANQASAFKAALQRLKKRKAKRMEQLKIIEAIKTSNLAMEEKIKGEEEELTKMTTSYSSDNGASSGFLGGGSGAAVEIVSLHQVVAQDNSNNEEEAAMIEATMKA